MANDESEEKTLPPTKKKLRDARKKGQVARSRNLAGCVAGGRDRIPDAGWCQHHGRVRDHVRDRRQRRCRRLYHIGLHAVWAAAVQAALRAVLPLVVLGPMLVVLASMVMMQGIPFATNPLVPRLEKINPFEGFKRLFRLRSLVEFVKSLIKLTLIVTLAVAVVAGGLNGLMQMPTCGVNCVAAGLHALSVPLLSGVAGVFVVSGLVDVGLQAVAVPTRPEDQISSEAERERKDMDGDPHLRRERRRIMREAVRLAGGLGLRRATMVVRDGGGITIGLRYKIKEMPAPVVVCRARDDRAATMLAEAREMRLPSAEDASLAASLYRVPPGHGIPEQLFRPVALALSRAGVV